ncbi:hypothetical protein [Nocardioides aurantiacus]|uniref:Uncharacterized protein n=1 Tax=Nocardioides aurantiacus TaxID=86796 RepID=A0A3N2CTP9_9ACTN|nr:hypothetical protein [Nocardioides aurantiacus]ROR90912.1 hypothetical protein EDD33_1761 [Nocardioides aurantiacus]
MARYDVTSTQALNLRRRLLSEQNRDIIVGADELRESHGLSVLRSEPTPARDSAVDPGAIDS